MVDTDEPNPTAAVAGMAGARVGEAGSQVVIDLDLERQKRRNGSRDHAEGKRLGASDPEFQNYLLALGRSWAILRNDPCCDVETACLIGASGYDLGRDALDFLRYQHDIRRVNAGLLPLASPQSPSAD